MHVVRCFDDPNVVHVDGSIDPVRDIETINLELIFSDLEILERRIAKTTKAAQGDKSLRKELVILEKLKEGLEEGKVARLIEFDDPDDKAFVDSLTFLLRSPCFTPPMSPRTIWPMTEKITNMSKSRDYAKNEGSEVFVLCAKIEEEIAELDNDEKKSSSPIWALAPADLTGSSPQATSSSAS